MTEEQLSKGVILNNKIREYRNLMNSIKVNPGWNVLEINPDHPFRSLKEEEKILLEKEVRDYCQLFKDFLQRRLETLEKEFEQL